MDNKNFFVPMKYHHAIISFPKSKLGDLVSKEITDAYFREQRIDNAWMLWDGLGIEPCEELKTEIEKRKNLMDDIL